MFKSRTLTRDLGDQKDGKFYAQSSSLTKGTPAYDAVFYKYDSLYEEGHANAATLSTNFNNVGTESIESTTRGRRYFNSCTHLKYYVFNYAYLLFTNYPVGGNTSYLSKYYRKSTLGGAGVLGPVASRYTWADCDAIQRRAWWSMQPRFESEVSMLNFIYELKDFKSLAKMIIDFNWGKAMSALRRVRGTLREMEKQQKIASALAKTSAAGSKIWADLWLANAFALQPLLMDLKAIGQLIEDTAEAAQAKFAAQSDFYQKSHYSETLEDVRTGTWGVNSNSMWFTGNRLLSKFTATLEYTYDYEVRKGWDLIKHCWGLNLTAGVVWEAIPFSFLVDYFYKVGDAIRNMALDPNVKSHIFQYCESFDTFVHNGVSIETSNVSVLKFYSPSNRRSNDLHPGLVPVCGYSGEYFRRRVTSPNQGAALPRLSNASKGQYYNMAALVRGFMR